MFKKKASAKVWEDRCFLVQQICSRFSKVSQRAKVREGRKICKILNVGKGLECQGAWASRLPQLPQYFERSPNFPNTRTSVSVAKSSKSSMLEKSSRATLCTFCVFFYFLNIFQVFQSYWGNWGKRNTHTLRHSSLVLRLGIFRIQSPSHTFGCWKTKDIVGHIKDYKTNPTLTHFGTRAHFQSWGCLRCCIVHTLSLVGQLCKTLNIF